MSDITNALNLEKLAPSIYKIAQEGTMRVPGLVIASEELFQDPEIAKPLDQVRRVAELPGIVGYSIAMPDVHWGYGFPIGGVAAMDAEHGVISPGGVGYDINCGVRLALIDGLDHLTEEKKQTLLKALFKNIPSGVGRGRSKQSRGLSDRDYAQLVVEGASWSLERGFGLPIDLEYMESNGRIEGADILAVSEEAKKRGRDQLGSIGSGNHFVEIGKVETLYHPLVAQAWGVKPGQLYVLIHTGSRGFGHQICQDTLQVFIKKGYAEGLSDRQLVAAPINSEDGQNYFKAMAAAANYAFNNRQQVLHAVRKSFQEVCGLELEQVRLLYDVCHNIAKFEEYEIEGRKRRLCVHRKGATRAFGPGSKELNPLFQKTGQPVLVPGDMGRASHLMVGKGATLSWCSCCHGAGRARSRSRSLQEWGHKDTIGHMRSQGVLVMANSPRTIEEEMPNAYKDVNQVVDSVQEAGFADKVARLKPELVIKG